MQFHNWDNSLPSVRWVWPGIEANEVNWLQFIPLCPECNTKSALLPILVCLQCFILAVLCCFKCVVFLWSPWAGKVMSSAVVCQKISRYITNLVKMSPVPSDSPLDWREGTSGLTCLGGPNAASRLRCPTRPIYSISGKSQSHQNFCSSPVGQDRRDIWAEVLIVGQNAASQSLCVVASIHSISGKMCPVPFTSGYRPHVLAI